MDILYFIKKIWKAGRIFEKFREIWLSRETPIAGVITSITFVLAKAESEKKLKKIREMLASLEYL